MQTMYHSTSGPQATKHLMTFTKLRESVLSGNQPRKQVKFQPAVSHSANVTPSLTMTAKSSRAFDLFRVMCAAHWAKKAQENPEWVDEILPLWNEELRAIPLMVIEPAIKKLVIKKGPFVPSSPLPLIEVCHELQPEDFQQGFKSARAAYIEAYTHLKAPKVGARWSSPAVYAAAVETFFERNGTSMVSEPEYFARSYRKIVWGFLHGDALDDPPPVLSASQSLENKQKKNTALGNQHLAKLQGLFKSSRGAAKAQSC